MSARVLRTGGVLSLVLTFLLAAPVAAADTQFLIHDDDTEVEPVVGGVITVCTFHLHAVPTGTDDHETGTWEIRAPGGSVVLSGDYETIGTQDDRIPDTGTMSLPDGNYTLFWDDESPIDDSHGEKALAVVCGGGGPTASPSPTPSGGGGGGGGGVLPTTGVNPGTGGAIPTLPPTDALGPTPAAAGGQLALAVSIVLVGISVAVYLLSPRRRVRQVPAPSRR